MVTGTEINLAERIKQLQADRERHAQALAEIDQVLDRVNDALRTVQGRPTGAGSATEGQAGPRRRGRFTQTAEQSVLNFIGTKNNPSTAEINAHWRAEGRKGTANVTLLKLLKESLIRRVEDPSVRGSRYVLASPADSRRPPVRGARA